MRSTSFLIFFALMGGTWRLGHPTCVLESDFGFVLNCAFKKSGLFRVRNLGGIKAHVGLGFTVGDELGFKESLTNVDQNRRRSVQGNSAFQAAIVQQQQASLAKVMAMRKASGMEGLVVLPSSASKIPDTSTTIPPFKPIPPAPERPIPTGKPSKNSVPTPTIKGVVPMFNAMPQSISRISTTKLDKQPLMAVIVPAKQANDKLSSTFAIRTLPSETINNDLQSELPYALPPTVSNSIQALSAATNISAEAIETALILRQQQLLKTTTTTSTTTTTRRPPTDPPRNVFSAKKVMNAPKEYYPVGYDKNFDDNFASRVDLPETSFHCGDQKHFPGLYADEDLGCMVFHVCALTDDGLIMKSFLCPESTLFDQTILKCNWWFYVECRNSKKLYDSNIPISKSYQLMKALTFFSSYKKEADASKSKEKD